DEVAVAVLERAQAVFARDHAERPRPRLLEHEVVHDAPSRSLARAYGEDDDERTGLGGRSGRGPRDHAGGVELRLLLADVLEDAAGGERSAEKERGEGASSHG